MAALLGLFAQTAQAASIGIYDDAAAMTGLRGTLTCDAGCEVLLLQPSTYSATVGQIFTVHPPNKATELAFVNNNLVPGDTAYTSYVKDESPKSDFITSALYILFKLGGGNSDATFLVHNTSGGNLGLTWAPTKGTGSGLSHTSSFGGATIPLPASGLLLLGAIGGLTIARRRKAA
ncbi:VPLPA-CTERM sorting domain-containing protein [Actibacterium sp. XHP0104]|uniref:VPLPA-CTERM sorting domain-containing protein n=1 Tax=Actibacterium sp. XHP0104 TaxID=2984335 RepID=UPI0021E86B90|nr:VPLPA-CTERM sorting domain-containing protein [Actibacterium sp. XHP0104]MCV2881855.1 VPLPA-CTERM sorting domain-containing protein [Actibacterium sp. XHP0104]